ncbi:hypothetical protein GCM10011375_22960 [Hymenobacter qilianensis]|uniref:Uncharacterized protein n=2 Tax=Hymenobacter qilianensis TaxID=1385715 RepID=A0ACB5PSA8_9BACT|nr:hypothetical protein [Hymenobacter qilianensis]QNP52400.1 hypothetical protein H9L05_00980 [Hymenobacter qilianensis]GGF67355.1 hypothetical protein GCM10011375_22960 [Hymenobacter qilianensis]
MKTPEEQASNQKINPAATQPTEAPRVDAASDESAGSAAMLDAATHGQVLDGTTPDEDTSDMTDERMNPGADQASAEDDS